MRNIWKITACLQWPDGKLFSNSKPFNTYLIEASNEYVAIDKLTNTFPGCKMTIYGKPICSKMTDEMYENGK